jgi:hypothetical protein
MRNGGVRDRTSSRRFRDIGKCRFRTCKSCPRLRRRRKSHRLASCPDKPPRWHRSLPRNPTCGRHQRRRCSRRSSRCTCRSSCLCRWCPRSVPSRDSRPHRRRDPQLRRRRLRCHLRRPWPLLNHPFRRCPPFRPSCRRIQRCHRRRLRFRPFRRSHLLLLSSSWLTSSFRRCRLFRQWRSCPRYPSSSCRCHLPRTVPTRSRRARSTAPPTIECSCVPPQANTSLRYALDVSEHTLVDSVIDGDTPTSFCFIMPHMWSVVLPGAMLSRRASRRAVES